MTFIDDGEKITDIQNKAAMIWSIADKLTGAYKPHEYGLVIIPLTVLRRLDCALEPTRDAVLAKYDELKSISAEVPDTIMETALTGASKLSYYSINRKGLKSVLENPKDVAGSLRRFIANFSRNVRGILAEFNFEDQIERMETSSGKDGSLLYAVIDEITKEKNDLSPSKISDIDMGYIFEEIIRRFSESYGEDAGQHYTPRDAIDLMVEILIRQEDKDSRKEVPRTVLDPACGTGGMLSEFLDYIEKINQKVHLQCYGQEYNPETYAICKANMTIKGKDAKDIRKGDTLSDYRFKGRKFNYIIMNPPFGREWKVQEKAVKNEAADLNGRFSFGLPPIGDSQMLFLSSAISSLEDPSEGNMIGGRIAIVHSGSPLFAGDAESGPSEIRRHILENDLLDAIIALPENIFYNTGIGTYVWVLDNNKEQKRKGKVQLIDATKMCDLRKKSVGMKRFDINRPYIDIITKAYKEFTDSSYGEGDKICESMIKDASEFGYVKAAIIAPELDENGNPVKNNRGTIVYDKSKNTYETIPLGKMHLEPNADLLKNTDVLKIIGDYLEKEVRPYVKGAEIDLKKTKIGFEIPFSRYFYKYIPPRPSEEILEEIKALNEEMSALIKKAE